MEEFQRGTRLKLGNYNVKVVESIGEGGQGIVYRVTCGKDEYALKWYKTEYLRGLVSQEEFYKNLSFNVERGAPSRNYLWPMAVSGFQPFNFGYLMKLRPKNFVGTGAILNKLSVFEETKTHIQAIKNLCKQFQLLHRKGYSFQDLNDGNFFVDVNTGEVLICDCDNIVPFGTDSGSSIIGKARYTAPEIQLKGCAPCEETDLYSMSILIFTLWYLAHPLEGKETNAYPCLTDNVLKKLYVEDPIFVYDPNRTENRPERGINNNVLNLWPSTPTYLKEAFIRAFTVGIKEPAKRLRLHEWVQLFNKLENDMDCCPECGSDYTNSLITGTGSFLRCGECRKEYKKPFCMNVQKRGLQGKEQIYLSPSRGKATGHMLKQHDIADEPNNDTVVGEVIANKNTPNLWGIRNLSQNSWAVKAEDGKNAVIDPDQILILQNGIEIDFGTAIAKID